MGKKSWMLALLICLLLAGCGQGGRETAGSSVVEEKEEVVLAGIDYAVPEGWQPAAASELIQTITRRAGEGREYTYGTGGRIGVIGITIPAVEQLNLEEYTLGLLQPFREVLQNAGEPAFRTVDRGGMAAVVGSLNGDRDGRYETLQMRTFRNKHHIFVVVGCDAFENREELDRNIEELMGSVTLAS